MVLKPSEYQKDMVAVPWRTGPRRQGQESAAEHRQYAQDNQRWAKAGIRPAAYQ